MTKIIESIINKDFSTASDLLEDRVTNIVEKKLTEKKKMIMAEMYSGEGKLPSVKNLYRGLTEDDVDESLLKVSRNSMKLKTPIARANQSLEEDEEIEEGMLDTLKGILKPSKLSGKMTNVEGKPLKTLKIAQKKKLEEDEQLDEARVAIVAARVRGGQIQRRKMVSNVPGMTLRAGKLVRMTAAERRRRKLGAKKAALKSKSKKSQAIRKRKISLMKRQRLGL